MNKRARACSFDKRTRDRIKARDRGCIFCIMGYRVTDECGEPSQIMHFVPRSQGGLGIEENGAWGCVYHHMLLDNSTYREEMMEMFEDYLKEWYRGWEKEKLVYRKWQSREEAEDDTRRRR